MARSYAIDSWIYVQQQFVYKRDRSYWIFECYIEKERDDNCILNCLYGKYSFGERAVLDEILNYIKNTDYHIRCSDFVYHSIDFGRRKLHRRMEKEKIKTTLTELLKRVKSNAVKDQAEEIMRWL